MELDQLTDDLYQFDPRGNLQTDIRLLRQRGPAPRVLLPGGITARVVVDPTLLKILARDPRVSKDARQHWPALRDNELPDGWPLLPWFVGEHAFSAEDTDTVKTHSRLRAPLDQALGLRQVRALEPRIHEITRAALDDVARAGTDPATGQPRVVDLREVLTLAVPIRVISELLGIPEHLRSPFQACADTLFDTTISKQQMLDNQIKLGQTLNSLIEYRTAHPGDDLTSILLSEQHHDLTYLERVATIRLILVAAIETVGNLQGSAIVNLLAHFDARTAFQTGQIKVDDVINETLRLNGPAGAVPGRFPTETGTITLATETGPADVVFEYGEPILPLWAAAGRDPDTNPNPDTFDVTRATRRDLAFGHGAHYCAGARLAIAQTRILLTLLFDRFPQMALAANPEEIGHTPGFIGDGPNTVPVLLSPRNPDKTVDNGQGAAALPTACGTRNSTGASRR